MALNINLLPEVRVVKLKSAANRRLATTITLVIGLVVGGIIIGLVFIRAYYAAEAIALRNQAKKLQAEVDKDKQLEEDASTIQEHLASFTVLNGDRIAASFVFDQLTKTIPPDVTVSSFELTEEYVATVGGTTTSYKSLGVFAKALEEYNVTFKQQAGLDNKAIFSEVEITQNSKSTTGNANEDVDYSITFKVDKTIAESNRNIAQ